MAKYKSTLEVIELLKAQGKTVTYRHRSDKGYLITSIDGKRFTGSTGNNLARQIVGAPISVKRSQQLAKIEAKRSKADKFITKKIRTEIKEINAQLKRLGIKSAIKNVNALKKIYRKHGKEAALKVLKAQKKLIPNKALIDQFEKTREAWESNENLKGKITGGKTLKKLKQEGIKETKKALKSLQRYAEGYVRDKNLQWFIYRLGLANIQLETNAFNTVISFCKRYQAHIKHMDLYEAYEYFYHFLDGTLPINDDNIKTLKKILYPSHFKTRDNSSN